MERYKFCLFLQPVVSNGRELSVGSTVSREWTMTARASVCLQPSKFFQLSYTQNIAQLVVAEAFSEDEGEYTCTATNNAGTDSCSCYLTVEGGYICTDLGTFALLPTTLLLTSLLSPATFLWHNYVLYNSNNNNTRTYNFISIDC